MDPAAVAALSMQECPDTKFAQDVMAAFPYRELIGSLMYLMVATRPDLAFSFSKLSKFNNSSRRAYLEAACKVLGYLRQTGDVGLLYTCEAPLQVRGVCNATFACHIDDRRSQDGYVFMMGGAAISSKMYTAPSCGPFILRVRDGPRRGGV